MLTASFGSPINLEETEEVFRQIKRLFQFLAYRQNVSFDRVELVCRNESDGRKSHGLFVDSSVSWSGDGGPTDGHLIGYRHLRSSTSRLLEDIRDCGLKLRHVPGTERDSHSYTPGRIAMIVSNFESEFESVYGPDGCRSETFLSVWNEVLSIIDEYAQKQTGKRRGYAKEIQRTISKINSSLSQKLGRAFRSRRDPMVSSVWRSGYLDDYDTAIAAVANSVAKLRNCIDHGRPLGAVEAHIVNDIALVERLTYAMRLTKAGLDAQAVERTVNALFG